MKELGIRSLRMLLQVTDVPISHSHQMFATTEKETMKRPPVTRNVRSARHRDADSPMIRTSASSAYTRLMSTRTS
jgi:hypothetical protein